MWLRPQTKLMWQKQKIVFAVGLYFRFRQVKLELIRLKTFLITKSNTKVSNLYKYSINSWFRSNFSQTCTVFCNYTFLYLPRAHNRKQCRSYHRTLGNWYVPFRETFEAYYRTCSIIILWTDSFSTKQIKRGQERLFITFSSGVHRGDWFCKS